MIKARWFPLTLTIMLIVAIHGSPAATANDGPLPSAAQVQSELQAKRQTLIDKLRGVDMPASVVKTNGRIEATQVDVSAKYPGRLESVMVEETRSITWLESNAGGVTESCISTAHLISTDAY
jgi:hypothetical protein